MANKRGLSDAEVLSVCLSELTNASESSELADQRSDALDRYLGEPCGDEVDGRSQVRTREVLETVEGLMPSLMRIFTEEDNLVEFTPVGPEDEEQAQQETDVIHHIFMNENHGFWNLYSFCKDALLSKTGVLKAWADTTESTEREEFTGLDDIQLGMLMSDTTVERDLIEYELTDDGHHAVFVTKRDDVKIRVCPVAPEEFGIKRDARSPYIADSVFSYCRFKKTLGELVEEGHEKDFLMSLATDEEVDTEERIARRHLEDEQEALGYANEWTMRTIWVSECYVRMDRDGDGIPELLKATIAGGTFNGSNGVLMDVEEIDAVPLFATPAVPITHKFYGLSIADLVEDLQQIQTTLLRQVLDNTYLANNGQTAVNSDHVNIEDLLTRRPGGLVRYTGDAPWNAVVGPIPHNPLPQQTGELFERLDERQKRRTGYGDEVAALDVTSLANVNTGVAAMAMDMARSKIELLARIIAEIGLKPLFHHMHELAIKNNYKAKAMRLRNQWVQVDPSQWKSRADSVVSVGIGKVSKERKIMGYEALLAKHQELTQQGAMGTLLMPHHTYRAYKGWIEAWGFEPDLFLQDPSKLPPPPPKGPDPQQELMQAQAQALVMDGQSKIARAQVDQQRVALEREKLAVEARYRETETLLKAQIENLKTQQAALRSQMDAEGKVASMAHQSQMKDVDTTLKAYEMRLDQMNADRDRDLEWYKTLTTAAVKGEMPETPEQTAERESAEAAQAAAEAQEAMARERKESERDAMIVQMFGDVQAAIEEFKVARTTPQDVEYDDKGLIKAIGGRAVERDDSGRVRRIG